MTFTEVDARDALVNAVRNAWLSSQYSDVDFYGENSPKPVLDRLDSVMEFDVEFLGDSQITINGTNPDIRTTGKLVLTFGVRESTGSRKALAMRSYMKQAFKAKWFGSVRTLIPRSAGEFSTKGWYFVRLDVPFRFDYRD